MISKIEIKKISIGVLLLILTTVILLAAGCAQNDKADLGENEARSLEYGAKASSKVSPSASPILAAEESGEKWFDIDNAVAGFAYSGYYYDSINEDFEISGDYPKFELYFTDEAGNRYFVKRVDGRFVSKKRVYNEFFGEKWYRTEIEFENIEELTIPKEIFAKERGAFRFSINMTSMVNKELQEQIIGSSDINYKVVDDRVVLSVGEISKEDIKEAEGIYRTPTSEFADHRGNLSVSFDSLFNGAQCSSEKSVQIRQNDGETVWGDYITLESTKLHFANEENIAVEYLVHSEASISDISCTEKGLKVVSVNTDNRSKRIFLELACEADAEEYFVSMEIKMSSGESLRTGLHAFKNKYGVFISQASKEDAREGFFGYALSSDIITRAQYERIRKRLGEKSSIQSGSVIGPIVDVREARLRELRYKIFDIFLYFSDIFNFLRDKIYSSLWS